MAETEQTSPQRDVTKRMTTKSFSIWPPAQRTRDAVVNRLIETLSTPSVLSKRYGTLPPDEAAEAGRRIEEEAFAVATDFASADDDGIEILQVYSREISNRMLEAVKSRSASGSAVDGNNEARAPDVDPPPTASDEDTSMVTES